MAKKIYIGNLSYTTTDDRLRTLFEMHGEVTSVNIIKDRNSGRSRGFGFVEMPSDQEALEAIEALNGQTLDGRRLRVDEAQQRKTGWVDLGRHRL